MRSILAVVMGVAVVLGGSTAFAQGLGTQRDLAFSADRLFGIYVGERQVELANGNERDIDFSLFGLAWGSETTPLNRPRLAIDYFVINSLSLGGSLGFYAIDVEDNDGSGFFLGPRVGYLLSFGQVAGFWPRGGFIFYTIDDDSIDQRQFAFDFEGMFVLSPAEHFAFLIGPTIDIGVGGEWGDLDMHEWSIGLGMGLIGWVGL